MDEPKVIHVMLVDDHDLVREGFEGVLRRHTDFAIVASVGSGAKAVQVFPTLSAVDVVLLDVRMHDMDGIETLMALRALDGKVAIVMLASDQRDETVRRAIAGGANGFLLKSIRSWDLAEAVRKVASTGRIPAEFNVAATLKNDAAPRLTERERLLLKLMASGSTNEEIAEVTGISTNTVRSHLSSILNKLDATSRTEAVITAMRSGIIDLD